MTDRARRLFGSRFDDRIDWNVSQILSSLALVCPALELAGSPAAPAIRAAVVMSADLANVTTPGWPPFTAFACRESRESTPTAPRFETGYYVKTLREARNWQPPGSMHRGLRETERKYSQQFGVAHLIETGKDGAFLLVIKQEPASQPGRN